MVRITARHLRCRAVILTVMFGLNSRAQKTQCGVVIDIGSGSVGAAIVISDVDKAKPKIIWSHREYVIIKDTNSEEVPLKEITTSLINTFLHIGSNGIKKMKQTDLNFEISSVQVTISAPWTYTVTKTINFTDEATFKVNKNLVDELTKTAEEKAFTSVSENNIFQENQLEIIDNRTAGIRINGYSIEKPRNIETKSVSLSHITAITQKKILATLRDSMDKIFPKADLVTHSSMYMFYDVLKHMNPDTVEVCLVDVTSEATEIGIIREGILTHVTHTAFGTFSLAREIAIACKIPKEEAYSYLKCEAGFLESKLSKQKLKELNIILEAYEDKIAELFKVTGDVLAIPKTLFLHSEVATEEFFINHLEKAAKKATTMRHNIHPITSLFFEEGMAGDTRLLLSTHFFHRTHIHKTEDED